MKQRVPVQPIKWHGGKSYLANWIHSLAPPSVIEDPANGYTHRNIAFAGGLGEFWNWEPVGGISETINDLDDTVSDFWTVLAWPEYFRSFQRIVSAIPLGDKIRNDFKDFAFATDPERWLVPRAVAFFLKFRQSRQGLGNCYCTPTTRTRRGMNENVSAWLSAVEGLPDAHERLIRVEVRNMDVIEFIRQYDHPRALFYFDPPYMHETRSTVGEYAHEMTVMQHALFLTAIAGMKGRFMLSGYDSPLYRAHAHLRGWYCTEREIDNKASSSKTKEKRIECLWTNYQPLGIAA
jgi:DNA adenine methylase